MFLSWEMAGGRGGEGARIIRQTADQNLVVAFLGRRFCTKQNNLP